MSSNFLPRHIGPNQNETNEMLSEINASSLNQLIKETIPASILTNKKLNLPEAQSEFEYLQMMRQIASKNKVFRTYIGLGYYNTVTPSVILRNIFENPGWYTQYTPYQAEIAQGRLEMLLNYQTVVSDLTGLPVSNASLLDEGTAAAEAMSLLFHANGKEETKNVFLVAENCFPQTIDILKTRALPVGIELKISSSEKFQFAENVFGCIVQYPDAVGSVTDYSSLIEEANKSGAKVVMATDLLALTLLKSPGELGADVAIGSAQDRKSVV